MQNQFSVAEIVKKANRRLLLLCLFVIVVVIAIGAFFSNYLYNFVSGPFELPAAEVAAMREIGDQRYVTIKGDYSDDLGYELVEDGGKVKASYAVLLLGDRLLIVETPGVLGENIPTTYTGELIPISDEFRDQVITEVERSTPNARGLFLPFMMKEHNYRTNGFIGLAIGGVILLLCMGGLFLFIQRGADPTRHPIMKNLAVFGDMSRTVPHLEHEMSYSAHETIKDVHLTKTWLVKTNGKTHLTAAPYRDLIWIYKKVTQHRTNGINTGKTYTVELHNRHGKSIVISGKENVIDNLIEAIYPHAPWSIYGFNTNLQQAWNKDRANLIAAVDERREQLRTAGTTSQAEPQPAT
ncbi:MAG: DUF6709 family protein [Aggregatilineales bacterium]